MAGVHPACLLAAGVLLLLPTASPQKPGDNQYLSEVRGGTKVVIEPSARKLHGMTAADVAAYEKGLARIRDVLLEQPVFHPILGADVRGYLGTGTATSRLAAGPVPGIGVLQFYQGMFYPKLGKPGWLIATTDEIWVYVNNPVGGLERINELRDTTEYFYEPARTGEIAGLPLLRGELACEYIVMARDGQLPWVPVTREEYARAWLAHWKKKAAANAADWVSPRVASRHRDMLEAMSPPERQMQARHGGAVDPLGPPMAPAGTTRGRPLVKPGWDWADRSLPRTEVQLVIFKFWYSGALDPDRPGPSSDGQVTALRIWETLHRSDWKAIRDRILGSKETTP